MVTFDGKRWHTVDSEKIVRGFTMCGMRVRASWLLRNLAPCGVEQCRYCKRPAEGLRERNEHLGMLLNS